MATVRRPTAPADLPAGGREIATWYPGVSRTRGYDVRLLGYNTDRKIHVRRLDTGRDFYVWPHELGGMTGGIPALNEAFARLPYIPRKGGHDPGCPQLGPSTATSPGPARDDDPLEGALL